jgi:hypothetical protein
MIEERCFCDAFSAVSIIDAFCRGDKSQVCKQELPRIEHEGCSKAIPRSSPQFRLPRGSRSEQHTNTWHSLECKLVQVQQAATGWVALTLLLVIWRFRLPRQTRENRKPFGESVLY